MSDERLEIRFDDDDALGRTMRAIVMVADNAIGELIDLGWTRKTVTLEVDSENPLPCWVKIRKRRVFEINIEQGLDSSVSIRGVWLEQPKAPGVIDKFWGI